METKTIPALVLNKNTGKRDQLLRDYFSLSPLLRLTTCDKEALLLSRFLCLPENKNILKGLVGAQKTVANAFITEY